MKCPKCQSEMEQKIDFNIPILDTNPEMASTNWVCPCGHSEPAGLVELYPAIQPVPAEIVEAATKPKLSDETFDALAEMQGHPPFLRR